MNDTYANAILAAVQEFGGTKAGVSTYKLNRVTGHPNIQEHEAYFEVLKDVILNLPEKFVPSVTVIPEGDGESDQLNWEDINNN